MISQTPCCTLERLFSLYMDAAECFVTDIKAIKKSVCASLLVGSEIKKPHGDMNKGSAQ